MDEEQRAERQEQQEAKRRRREEADQIDHELAQIDDTLRSLTAAMLEEAGYHRHKGQWRKQRHGRRESTNQAEIAVAEAFAKADSEDATREDGRRLLALLQQHPGALGLTVDMPGAATEVLIRQMKTSEANRALNRRRPRRQGDSWIRCQIQRAA